MSNNSNQIKSNTYETIELCPKLQRKQPIYIEEIVWLEGLGNYTMIYFRNGQKILTSKTLGLFDQQLPKEIFMRVNRSYVVRLHEVSLTQTSTKALQIILPNGPMVEVSRRKKRIVRQFFKLNLSK